jgi:hypothetical protein
MSLNPWPSSMFVRYRDTDQRRDGSTSPVGTNHKPVVPDAVVVAGRVSVDADGGGWGVWANTSVEAVKAVTRRITAASRLMGLSSL